MHLTTVHILAECITQGQDSSLTPDVRWEVWNTKDPKSTLREHRQVYMQSLINNNPNAWSDHQSQQINDLLDHYKAPLPDMPEILDY